MGLFLRFVGPDFAAGGTTDMPQMLGDPVVMSRVAHFGLHSYTQRRRRVGWGGQLHSEFGLSRPDGAGDGIRRLVRPV